jgi:hypothetical protein
VSAQPAPFSADVADTLRSAWSHGAGKDLVADPGVLQLDSLGNDDGPQLTDLWPEGVGADIGSALAAALAPIRWDDWSAYNAHRPFPSARAKQAHSVHVAAGGVRARVDEVRIRLIDHEVEDPSVPPSVLVRAEPERLPGGYGPIRFAIATLEAGHVVGALVERFAERGFAVTRSLDCSDPRRPGLWLQPRRVGPSVPPAPWPRRCSGLDPAGSRPIRAHCRGMPGTSSCAAHRSRAPACASASESGRSRGCPMGRGRSLRPGRHSFVPARCTPEWLGPSGRRLRPFGSAK